MLSSLTAPRREASRADCAAPSIIHQGSLAWNREGCDPFDLEKAQVHPQRPLWLKQHQGAARDLDGAALAGQIRPHGLITLLRAVEFGWRQKRLEENAKQIGNLGKELYDRVCKMGDHFAHLGSKLCGAVDSYNQAVGSLETRVLVSARRFNELGAADPTKEVETLESIEVIPRKLQAPEMQQMNA